MKLHITIGAVAIAMSSAAQAASMKSTVNGGSGVGPRPSSENNATSLAKPTTAKMGMKKQMSAGTHSFTGLPIDTTTVFAAPGGGNPFSPAQAQGDVSRMKFKHAPPFAVADKIKAHKVKQTKIISRPDFDLPHTRPSFPTSGTVVSAVRVPDGGSSFVLLSTCLLGLQVLRRKL